MPPKRKTAPNNTNSRAAKAQKKASLLVNLIQEFRDLKSIKFDLLNAVIEVLNILLNLLCCCATYTVYIDVEKTHSLTELNPNPAEYHP